MVCEMCSTDPTLISSHLFCLIKHYTVRALPQPPDCNRIPWDVLGHSMGVIMLVMKEGSRVTELDIISS
jgi:hypothetical protein